MVGITQKKEELVNAGPEMWTVVRQKQEILTNQSYSLIDCFKMHVLHKIVRLIIFHTTNKSSPYLDHMLVFIWPSIHLVP